MGCWTPFSSYFRWILGDLRVFAFSPRSFHVSSGTSRHLVESRKLNLSLEYSITSIETTQSMDWQCTAHEGKISDCAKRSCASGFVPNVGRAYFRLLIFF